jgi:hypothetical protein
MNHEAGEDINLGHDVIKGEAKAHQSLKQKDGFEKSPLSMIKCASKHDRNR